MKMNYEDFSAFLLDAKKQLAYVSDPETREMLFMTRAAMQAVGCRSEQDYRGKKCYKVLQGLSSPCAFCSNEKLLDGQGPFTWEQYNPIIRKWLRLESRLMVIDGHRCRVEFAENLADQPETRPALQDQLDMQTVLSESIRALSQEADVQTAVNLLLRQTGDYYEADRVCIFELSQAKKTITNTYEWCANGITSQLAQFQNIPTEGASAWLDSFSDDTPQQMSSDEANRYAPMDSILSDRGVTTILVAPLRKRDRLVGFLGVDNAKAHTQDNTLLRLLAGLITEEFQKRQLLSTLDGWAFTDRLTGLYNRRKYLQTLEALDKASLSSLAVIALDLDGLKELNEELGHDVGDRFICQCAGILRRLDLDVYRIDGDEFILFLPELSESDANQKNLALRIALEELSPNSASVGFAWSEAPVDIFALLSEADEQMFAEKQLYYRQALNQDRQVRAGVATDVLKKIRDDNFLVYFQPQISLKDGSVYGAEALVRKSDAEGNLISPDRFVPLYEAEGVISHMDLHVLEMVCSFLASWRKNLGKYPHVSVNFSRLTLMEPDVISHILATCKEYGVSPQQITVEVTESTGKLTQQQLHSLVLGLQEAGFSVSLDDFGSRYSNLSILTSIDFQLIKLDKSLIDQVGGEEKGAKIVKNLIQLCKDTIHTPSMAEGVETKEQASILQEFSCDYVQGYYFSRPLPAEEFTALLKANKTYSI